MALDLKAIAEQWGSDLVIADGFNDAIVGVGERAASPPIVCYDRAKCIEILVEGGASREDAEEHFDFNVVGAWVGEATPIFITLLQGDDDGE